MAKPNSVTIMPHLKLTEFFIEHVKSGDAMKDADLNFHECVSNYERFLMHEHVEA
jgi:hypothetical protein